MLCTGNINRILIMCMVCVPTAVALGEPQPGDVYREYAWVKKAKGEPVPQLVFSPSGKRPDEKFRSPRVGQIELDLTHAIRAEVVVEHWSGHIGTAQKRIRFNGHDWLDLPLPQGTPGKPECCIAALTQPAIEVPLSHLKQGLNEFALTCGTQVCYNFDYPAFAVYGITVRVFLNPSAPHPEGRLVSPEPGAALADSPMIEVSAQSPQREIRRVDVIAEYEDYDWEGNGLFRQWHYEYEFTRLTHHVGTASVEPYRVTWDTHWVPDQSSEIQLVARITDANGVTYVTPAVGGIQLRRDRNVRLYKPSDVPQRFDSRDGVAAHCTIDLPDTLDGATAAQLVLATHGPHGEPAEFGLNGHRLGTVQPGLPGRSRKELHSVSVPLDAIAKGKNRFHVLSRTKTHAVEVLWPGPVLLVETPSKQAENAASGISDERRQHDE